MKTRLLALPALLALLSACATIEPQTTSYSVAVLGDTHFDAADTGVYHSKNTESQQRHLREFKRNGEMWGERMPSLIAASGALAREQPTRFVLQLGDIVQGDCDDAKTHVKMLEDALRVLRAAYPENLPFLTVMGNHDVRGEGARKAYFKFIEAYLSGQLGRDVSYPVFSFPVDNDLWVFCDFETAEIDRISDEIDAHPDARYVFLVTHGPVTAQDAVRWYWHLAGRHPAKRQRLIETLSRRHAIVLSGHTHSTTFYRHENEFGGFSEMTVNSVWTAPERATAKPIHDSPEQYGTRARANVDKESRADYDRDHDEFRKSLKEYFFSTAAGHCRLDVCDTSVTLSFYPGDARAPARTFVMYSKKE